VHALADLVARDDAYGEVFNIGSTEEISILALAQWIRGMSESQSEITVVPYDEAYETGFEDMRRRVPDISKIDQLLGWRPTKDVNGILAEARRGGIRGSRLTEALGPWRMRRGRLLSRSRSAVCPPGIRKAATG
jgi:nucleoside-diphosphate-sugar epimerase